MLGAGLWLPLAVWLQRAQSAERCAATPRQTRGPFFPVDEQADKDVDLTRVAGRPGVARGLVIRVQGRVLDASCAPVTGALVELWQADSNGRYHHPGDRNPAPRDPNFQGSARAVTDAEGRYWFKTIKPASYPLRFLDGEPEDAAVRTPHIHFRVTGRGVRELVTQMYFFGEALNDSDVVLSHVPATDRSSVVIAPLMGGSGALPDFRFDLRIERS
jgi:protocatechuate 3,4-dioxygenase beta subunit